MIRRRLPLLAAVAVLATAPAVARAQEPAASARAAPEVGPRLDAGFKSYRPSLVQQEESLAAAAAADRTVITISTLGVVLLVILLILLLA